MNWIACVLLYGALKGAREIFKKKAMVINTVMEVLVAYTVLSLGMVVVTAVAEIAAGDCSAGEYLFGLRASQYGAIAVKSFVIFVAWICGFRALHKMPVSVYGILDMARVVFAALLGMLVLGERPSGYQAAGIVLVCVGLSLLRYVKDDTAEEAEIAAVSAAKSAADLTAKPVVDSAEGPAQTGTAAPDTAGCPVRARWEQFRRSPGFYVFLAMVSCFLNAVSGNMDKLLMRDGTMRSGQLQLWYMIFLVVMYMLYTAARHIRLDVPAMLRNPWIWGMSVLFVIADRALFIANGSPQSRVVVMTVLKQSCTVVTILGGWLVFREKKIAQKLACVGVVIVGILLSVR